MDEEIEPTQSERLKDHFHKYKHVYAYAACGGVIVVLGVMILKKSPTTQIINTVAPVFNNSNEVLMGGYLRKIVYCPELNRYFGSVKEAAEFAKVSVPAMSKHLNGHSDRVNGLVYKIVAVAN